MKKGMVVTPQPEATEAGRDILAVGGNAVDAAIATALVQTVVDPLMCGIAGFGSLAVYLPSKKVHTYYDFHSPAPSGVRPDMWEALIEGEARDGYGFVLKGNVNDIGYQSICVPASLKAYAEAHRDHGKLPWEELFGAAIGYAESGWNVRPHVHSFWTEEGTMGRVGNAERIAFTPAARELYCRPDGSPKRVGDRVVNGDYGAVLRAIAKRGADAFYRGEIADTIDADMRAHGGFLRRSDLEAFHITRNEPLSRGYRNFRVTSNQAPGGGIMLLEMLGALENFELRALGHNTVAYIRTVAEAMKSATRDKDRFIGDPSFVDVPTERLISKEYCAEIAGAIKRGEKADVARFNAGLPSKETTQVSICDAEGNCVSMTHSLGMPSGVITDGLGFMYNGCMGVFDPRPGRAGSLAPGKARFSSICPSIIFENDKPVLVIGAPGATQIAMGVLQVTLNVLDFGMTMLEAVSTPRFSATSNVVDLSNRIPRSVERELVGLGYQTARSPLSHTFAWVHGIKITSDGLEGGADPATDGMALPV
ncbi:MAG: gamma-glutamyltransferase family protein [Proteobacteria bacterium]|nr:gamma-glutamyltransferase family protein [Pseudomonadota bacterium]